MTTSAPSNYVETFSTARSFVEALRLTDDRWNKDTGRWVFRGHADSAWKLLPRLWRGEANPYFEACHRLIGTMDEATKTLSGELPERRARILKAAAIVAAEHSAVNEFVRLADQLRFPIPLRPEEIDTQPEVGDLSELCNAALEWAWNDPLGPPGETEALAQHHGVPTRLLDWTGNPLVAAFFGAHESQRMARLGRGTDHVAVWAIHRIIEMATENRLRFLRCAGQFNSFLVSQQGLFTWDSLGARDFIVKGQWPSQDEVLTASPLFQALGGQAMRKLVLPASEAPALLRLLRVEGVSFAHLRPTLDNVAATVMDHTEWPYRRA